MRACVWVCGVWVCVDGGEAVISYHEEKSQIKYYFAQRAYTEHQMYSKYSIPLAGNPVALLPNNILIF